MPMRPLTTHYLDFTADPGSVQTYVNDGQYARSLRVVASAPAFVIMSADGRDLVPTTSDYPLAARAENDFHLDPGECLYVRAVAGLVTVTHYEGTNDSAGGAPATGGDGGGPAGPLTDEQFPDYARTEFSAPEPVVGTVAGLSDDTPLASLNLNEYAYLYLNSYNSTQYTWRVLTTLGELLALHAARGDDGMVWSYDEEGHLVIAVAGDLLIQGHVTVLGALGLPSILQNFVPAQTNVVPAGKVLTSPSLSLYDPATRGSDVGSVLNWLRNELNNKVDQRWNGLLDPARAYPGAWAVSGSFAGPPDAGKPLSSWGVAAGDTFEVRARGGSSSWNHLPGQYTYTCVDPDTETPSSMLTEIADKTRFRAGPVLDVLNSIGLVVLQEFGENSELFVAGEIVAKMSYSYNAGGQSYYYRRYSAGDSNNMKHNGEMLASVLNRLESAIGDLSYRVLRLEQNGGGSSEPVSVMSVQRASPSTVDVALSNGETQEASLPGGSGWLMSDPGISLSDPSLKMDGTVVQPAE